MDMVTCQGKCNLFNVNATSNVFNYKNKKKEMTFLGLCPKISLYFVENSEKRVNLIEVDFCMNLLS